ncbi:ParB N-terminal domain-containing protein [Bradyrhizobium sp. 179]|uniref:ParB/Srx family N-terminal domain-containing protein n=1 Tax=Bradyrhizobium sp. 179 TaxID=2782648 RepID=UPI001FFA1FE1|nr:ParB/Srx family N-terminal domain-containing protein [Bradyrhizobium sp. 179]MCK1543404.1 ParB N-terminal domain-containing protein [Bradyrhizobium sp. 179]
MTIDVSKLPTEIKDIDWLKASPTNSKKHPQSQIEKLARSIAKHGIANTIQTETDGTIIAGHGRWLAAKHLGWTTVNVIVRTDLTKEQAMALRIADNQTVSTDYDAELLKAELLVLKDADYDLDSLGFDDGELEKLTADFGAIDESTFVEDIGEAVETQRAENVEKAKDIDQSAAPIGDALGFKRVTIEQSRTVRSFMSRIEAETGLQGAAALVAYIEQNGLAA